MCNMFQSSQSPGFPEIMFHLQSKRVDACMEETLAQENDAPRPGVKGSCLCGAIIFKATGKPEVCIQCFCNHCQKNAGGPFQIVSRAKCSRLVSLLTHHQCAKFEKTQISVEGEPASLKTYVLKDTSSGHPKHKVFCSQCGCTLWTIPTRHGGVHFMVRTSLLEDG